MIRKVIKVQVRPRMAREFIAGFKALNDLVVSKGLVGASLWFPVAGTVNETRLISEYESLAHYEQANSRWFGDADVFALWRALSEFIDGYPETELWDDDTGLPADP